MKKLVLVLGLAVVSLSASAQSMSVQASCQFNRAEGRCAVYNQWNRPIYCELRAQGQVASGAWGSVYEDATIYPGNYAYVSVYANNPQYDPIVNVRGSAQCRM